MCVVVSYDLCKIYLFPSEPVDKTTPTVHTSPAAKTFSKSAAAPRNGNVSSASAYKSPAAQNKPSYQPGAPSGRRTHSNILPYICYVLPLTWFCFCHECNIYFVCSCFFLPTEGSPTLLNHCCSAVTFIAGFIPDTPLFKLMSSIKTRGIPLMSSDYWLFPRIPLVK